MNLARRLSTSFAAAFVAAALSVSAHAAISSTGSFTGTNSETFESFQNYYETPGYYMANGVSVFGGTATMSATNSDMIVYEPNAGATFGLSTAFAEVSDGTKGLGLNSSSDAVTFVFASAINSFGGYFGAAYGYGWNGNIGFSFSDGSTAAYTYGGSGNSGGALVWQGWNSTVGISSVTLSGDYIVMDGLQVNGTASVPDASSTLPMLGGAVALLALIRRKR